MRNAKHVFSVCILSSLLYSTVQGGSVAGRGLKPRVKRDAASREDSAVSISLENLSKRSQLLDPLYNDVHTLFEAEPIPSDPGHHGVYTLFDKEEMGDKRFKRSLFKILRGKQIPRTRNDRTWRRSLFSIVRGMKKKPTKEQKQPKPVPKLAPEPMEATSNSSELPASDQDPQKNSVPADEEPADEKQEQGVNEWNRENLN